MNGSNALKLAESANAEVDVTRKRASTDRSEVDVESTRENGQSSSPNFPERLSESENQN